MFRPFRTVLLVLQKALEQVLALVQGQEQVQML
jgi:hypothetical protein